MSDRSYQYLLEKLMKIRDIAQSTINITPAVGGKVAENGVRLALDAITALVVQQDDEQCTE